MVINTRAKGQGPRHTEQYSRKNRALYVARETWLVARMDGCHG
jgi:hypothetical protein